MKEKEILEQLTLKEKISLLHGDGYWKTREIDRVGLKAVNLSDGPHGLRHQSNEADNLGLNKSDKATCFPTASALGATFDEELIGEMAIALAEECKDQNVNVILGPGINIKRSPLCGRNFEYFSEDPYLTGILASSYVTEIQKNGVGVSLKHFACNSQEMNRLISNSVVDLATLNEIYLKAFEMVVKNAKPWTIMHSYNLVNNEYAGESNYLLTKKLRHDWKFDGLVMSDWGAFSDHIKGYKNGQDLEMPGVDKSKDKRYIKLIKKGLITEEEINRPVLETIKLSLKAQEGEKIKLPCDYDKHTLLAQKIAENAMVLLKNDNECLPLSKKEKVMFVGDFAYKSRYQGGGSSNINPYKLDSLKDALEESDADYELFKGYNTDSDDIDEMLENEVLNEANNFDKVVLVVGLPDSYESEGYDRRHLNFPPNQLHLIDSVTKVHKNVALLVMCGSPVEMPFINNVSSILLAYLSGCQTGHAAYNLLYGINNPSGHLAETFPLHLEDNPIKVFPQKQRDVLYEEGQYIGYRYYEMAQKKVLFPFGHGLSYTSFKLSDFDYSPNTKTLTLNIKNIGKYNGKEVIQLYFLHKENDRKYIELKLFKKIELKVGESKKVQFELKNDLFTQYSLKDDQFIEYTGDVEVLIGTSCRDIVHSFIVKHKGQIQYILPEVKPILPTFESYQYNKKGKYNVNSTPDDIRTCALGRFLYKILLKVARKIVKDDPSLSLMIDSLINESPMRFLTMASSVSREQVEGIVDILNGHFFRGLGKLL
ncbi:MAG: glycoside hydrolase family 3 C-terminal domain-containing protein [Bacilli bacterium]|nr:glycoside hydrolase family 3 C-terminal domain-containing protein [Bacilli bacterium]